MRRHLGFKILAIVTFLGFGFVVFDLFLAPQLSVLARKIRQQTFDKETQIVKDIPFETRPVPRPVLARGENAAVTKVPLVVRSQPLGATVKINNKVVGQTPFEGMIPLREESEIALSLEGHLPTTRAVTPLSEKPLRFLFSMVEIPETPTRVHFKTSPDLDITKSTDELIRNELKKEKPELALKDESFYTVQVEALQDLKEAAYQAALYQAWGYKAFVCQTDLIDKGQWYRVRVGRFDEQKKAAEFSRKFSKETGATVWVVHEDGLCPKLVSGAPGEETPPSVQ